MSMSPAASRTRLTSLRPSLRTNRRARIFPPASPCRSRNRPRPRTGLRSAHRERRSHRRRLSSAAQRLRPIVSIALAIMKLPAILNRLPPGPRLAHDHGAASDFVQQGRDLFHCCPFAGPRSPPASSPPPHRDGRTPARRHSPALARHAPPSVRGRKRPRWSPDSHAPYFSRPWPAGRESPRRSSRRRWPAWKNSTAPCMASCGVSADFAPLATSAATARGGPVPHRHLMPRCQQVLGDGHAHVSQADKSDFHPLLLISHAFITKLRPLESASAPRGRKDNQRV